MGRRREQTFLQRKYPNGQQIHEKMLRCSTSSSGKWKSKPQWNSSSYLSKWLKSKTQETTGIGKEVEKKKPSCTVDWNASWCSHCGKQYFWFLEKMKNRSSNSTTGYLPKEDENTNSKRYTRPYVYSSVIYNSQIMEAAKCPSRD